MTRPEYFFPLRWKHHIISGPTDHYPIVQQKQRKDNTKMADDSLSIYDEIEIEDMTFDPNQQIYHYPCPCGDRFEIAIDDLRDGEEIAVCPSCSLMIRVIFDEVRFCNWRLGESVRGATNGGWF